jgi:hypothetical protein
MGMSVPEVRTVSIQFEGGGVPVIDINLSKQQGEDGMPIGRDVTVNILAMDGNTDFDRRFTVPFEVGGKMLEACGFIIMDIYIDYLEGRLKEATTE